MQENMSLVNTVKWNTEGYMKHSNDLWAKRRTEELWGVNPREHNYSLTNK